MLDDDEEDEDEEGGAAGGGGSSALSGLAQNSKKVVSAVSALYKKVKNN